MSNIKKNRVVLFFILTGLCGVSGLVLEAQKKAQALKTATSNATTKSLVVPQACKELAKHRKNKPREDLALHPSPITFWNLKNEELYAQCQLETTEEMIKRLQEQLAKDKKRWMTAQEATRTSRL